MIPFKHQEFIRLVANGETQSSAYQSTIGNNKVADTTARVKGSQLSKKYVKEIQNLVDLKVNAVQSVYEKKDVKTALESILSQAEVDSKLCDIILKAKHDGDRLRAIEVYNKRFGSNAPIKNDMNITQIPAPIIELTK